MYHRHTASYISRSAFFSALVFYALSVTTVTADTPSVESKEATSTTNTSKPLAQPNIVSCPAAFHNVTITDDATQCQQFETQVPAAMVYHTKQQPNDVVAIYQEIMSTLTVHAPVNQRTLLTSKNNHTRIIISPDNAGSQVDILVIPNQNR